MQGRTWAWRAALVGFLAYVAVFPGSTITVASGPVPAWGIWFGAALLILQGVVMVLWLAGRDGWPGLGRALLVAVVGFVVEYVGVNTGLPFGRYVYTDVLQPQLAGVPVPICCAWVMSALCANELARRIARSMWARLLLVASLVLLLDLQIETVATRVNSYWLWRDSGPYYAVPTLNFAGWWFTGLFMAWLLFLLEARGSARTPGSPPLLRQPGLAWISANIPALLYGLSTLMFTITNLAYGFHLAGAVGMLTLAAGAALASRWWRGASPAMWRRRRTPG